MLLYGSEVFLDSGNKQRHRDSAENSGTFFPPLFDCVCKMLLYFKGKCRKIQF